MSSPTFAVIVTRAPGAMCQRDAASQKSCAAAAVAHSTIARTKRVDLTSEAHDEIHPCGAWQGRVQMDVVHAVHRLVEQSGRIVVIDVAVLRVAQVEDVDGDLEAPGDP